MLRMAQACNLRRLRETRVAMAARSAWTTYVLGQLYSHILRPSPEKKKGKENAGKMTY